MKASLSLGKGAATKSDEFLEKFQTAFDPLPSFLENFVANFFNKGYGHIYARKHRPDSISKYQSILIQLLKNKHILNPEIILLFIGFMLKKPCLKFRKSAT